MSKFKIGDWVQFIDSDSTKYFGRCLDIRDTYHSDYGEITVVDVDWTDISHFIQDVEPWQPQEGEWCWFYSSGMNTPFFGRFKALVLISQTPDYLTEEQPFKPYTQCEPFIGTLPTFLQGK